MYNLQEAYLGVYYDLDEELTGDRKRKAVKKDAELMRRIEAKDKTPGLRQKRALIHRLLRPSEDRTSYGRGNKALRRMGYTPTEGGTFFNPFNEQLDLYDLIFDYLLDEGYADTEEAATVIMANMSEEWVNNIADAYVPYEGKPQENLRKKQDKLYRNWDKPGSEQRFHKLGKVDTTMTNPTTKGSREEMNRIRDLELKRRQRQ